MTQRELGKKVRDAKELRGCTQRELAKIIGVSAGTVAAWERGKWLPRGKRLIAMTKILDCTVDELLSQDEEANQKNNKKGR